MHGPALIPAGIDGEEFRHAFGVGLLKTAQKFLPAGVELGAAYIRITTARIAMPHINDSAAQRAARTAGDARNLKLQAQRDAGSDRLIRRIDADIGAIEFLIDE